MIFFGIKEAGYAGKVQGYVAEKAKIKLRGDHLHICVVHLSGTVLGSSWIVCKFPLLTEAIITRFGWKLETNFMGYDMILATVTGDEATANLLKMFDEILAEA